MNNKSPRTKNYASNSRARGLQGDTGRVSTTSNHSAFALGRSVEAPHSSSFGTHHMRQHRRHWNHASWLKGPVGGRGWMSDNPQVGHFPFLLNEAGKSHP